VWIRIYITFALLAATLPAADIILQHADRMVTDLSGEHTRIKLYGNIRIVHENRILRSGFADWDKKAGRVKFVGNVVLSDTLQRIYTDTLFYRRDDRFAVGIGNVRFERIDSTLIVTGGHGTYDGIVERLEMEIEPHLTSIDTIDSTLVDLDAHILIYEIRPDKGTAIDSVFVVITEQDTSKPVTYINSDSLIFYPNRDEIRAYSNVVVRQEDTRVTADSIAYFRNAGRIILSGNPVLSQGTNRLVGNRMILELKRGELDRLFVYGSQMEDIPPMGFWHPPEDSFGTLTESEFTAREMVFEFENNKLSLAHLIREATANYYPWPDDSLRRENNTTSGDSIVVWFVDNSMDSVEVHRNAEGMYIVEHLNADSARTVASTETLFYDGDYMSLSRARETVAIQGSGRLRYGDLGLDAGNIIYDIDTKVLKAEPSVEEDSVFDYPVLMDSKQTMEGRKIVYNIETGRGRMLAISTELDMGFFHGRLVHKARGETLYVANSDFIPCECETARTHFKSDRMKLIPRDKAVARNIVLYISRLPVFAIPFFVFPVESGRRSGLLTLDIGQFQKGERFVRNVGYYWAASDYWDCQAGFDFNEESGWVFRGKTNYSLRYKLNGNLSASYEFERHTEFLETTGSDRWSVSGSHLQYLWPNATLSGRASYVSDKEFLSDAEYDPQDRMQRTLSSNLAYSQSFDWGNVSLNAERTENLVSGRITTYLPKLRVSRYSRPLFEPEIELDRRFYHNLSLSINGLGVHYRLDDSTTAERHTGLQSDQSVGMPFSIGPYLSLNPSASGHLVTIDEDRDSVAWPVRFTYGASVSANTNLYGRFPFHGFAGVQSVKHDVSPSVSFSWAPEFEDAGNFYSFGGISPGYSSKKKSMGFSLTQDFSIQTAVDTLSSGRKIRLATVTTRGSYDFLAESRPLSDLSTSIRTSPFNWLSMTAGFTHSLYTETGDEISTFRLISRNLTTEFSHRGNIEYGDTLTGIERSYNLSLSHYLSESRSGGYSSMTHWLKGRASVFITRNWRVDYTHYYDIEAGNTVSEEFSIWRDLGCWEATFIWVPSGYRQGWHFRINIKNIPDIKIEGTRGNVR